MLGLLAGLALAGFLLASALLKLGGMRAAAAAMTSFGFRTTAGRWAALLGAIAAELALAVGVALGSERAAYAAAVLMLLFAASLVGTLMRQGAGAPCPCLGVHSRISGWAVSRNLALAVAFAALPSLWAAA
jgi:hypothetical protein